MFDILIQRAQVVDGSGCPPITADIGVEGDTINAIGELSAAEARTTIKAKELMVTEQLAEEQSKEPVEAVLDLLLEAEAEVSMIQFSMSEENLQQVLRLPWVMIGSDGASLMPHGEMGKGKRHPRSYGTFPRFLGRYVREKGLLTWQEAVRKATALPAERVGLHNRGLLKAEGFRGAHEGDRGERGHGWGSGGAGGEEAAEREREQEHRLRCDRQRLWGHGGEGDY